MEPRLVLLTLTLFLEASIFKAVTEAFVKAFTTRNIMRVASVVLFEVGFNRENVLAMQLGTVMPTNEVILI